MMQCMSKLKELILKIIVWFFDSTLGFTILILGYCAIMWILWSIHWTIVYNH